MLVAKDSVILYNGIQHKEGRPTKCIEQNKNQAEEKNINELRNKEYDKLADMLMKNLNISKIYEIMEKGV